MQDGLPPKVNNVFAEIIRASITNEDRREPHMIFIAHDISRRMKEQLAKENKDIHDFINDMCIEYLNKIDNEQAATDKYVKFSEMQLGEYRTPIGFAYNEEDEDIFAPKKEKK